MRLLYDYNCLQDEYRYRPQAQAKEAHLSQWMEEVVLHQWREM